MSLYAELKRRNVFRVAAAYIVLGWLLLQVSSVVLQFIAAPDWVGKAIIALLVIGFIPSLAIAWVFEVGPNGVQRDTGEPTPTNGQHGRRLDILTLVGVVLVAVIALAEQLRVPDKDKPGPASPPAAAVAPSLAEPPGDTTPAGPRPPDDSADFAPPPRASIAVLPFANMSPDPENEFFADGISEELLDVLSDIDGLKVASRTSSFAFKGRNDSVREIARSLSVAHVLEGSVRKQGLRVRITAQLIDAGTDQHLWSDTYDRELTDIFAVQEEIAQAISSALSGALGLAHGAKGIEVAPPTANLEAYELYLRGRQLFHQRGAALLDARRLLEEAVERDPEFAPAWAVLSAVHATTASYGAADEEESDALSRRSAERARELDDTLGLPYAVLGQSAAEGGRLIEGLEMLDRAIARDAADSTPHLWRGLMLLTAGHIADAEADFSRAVEMDPLGPINIGWYGMARNMRGDRVQGDAQLARAHELGWASAGVLRAPFSLADGERERAAQQLASTLERLPQPDPATKATWNAAVAATADPAAGAAFLAAMRARRSPFFDLAWLIVLGMHDEALALSAEQGPTGNHLHYRLAWTPMGRGVLAKPAFLRLAERDGLLAFWRAKGLPDGCRLVDTPERHLDCDAPSP
jgi:TolB-like protein/Tfp pilus assembly protein PilF